MRGSNFSASNGGAPSVQGRRMKPPACRRRPTRIVATRGTIRRFSIMRSSKSARSSGRSNSARAGAVVRSATRPLVRRPGPTRIPSASRVSRARRRRMALTIASQRVKDEARLGGSTMSQPISCRRSNGAFGISFPGVSPRRSEGVTLVPEMSRPNSAVCCPRRFVRTQFLQH